MVIIGIDMMNIELSEKYYGKAKYFLIIESYNMYITTSTLQCTCNANVDDKLSFLFLWFYIASNIKVVNHIFISQI